MCLNVPQYFFLSHLSTPLKLTGKGLFTPNTSILSLWKGSPNYIPRTTIKNEPKSGFPGHFFWLQKNLLPLEYELKSKCYTAFQKGFIGRCCPSEESAYVLSVPRDRLLNILGNLLLKCESQQPGHAGLTFKAADGVFLVSREAVMTYVNY